MISGSDSSKTLLQAGMHETMSDLGTNPQIAIHLDLIERAILNARPHGPTGAVQLQQC